MSQALENLLREERTFAPTEEFTAQANAKPGIHDEAAADFNNPPWEAAAIGCRRLRHGFNVKSSTSAAQDSLICERPSRRREWRPWCRP